MFNNTNQLIGSSTKDMRSLKLVPFMNLYFTNFQVTLTD